LSGKDANAFSTSSICSAVVPSLNLNKITCRSTFPSFLHPAFARGQHFSLRGQLHPTQATAKTMQQNRFLNISGLLLVLQVIIQFKFAYRTGILSAAGSPVYCKIDTNLITHTGVDNKNKEIIERSEL
jgi:hypothetical protein